MKARNVASRIYCTEQSDLVPSFLSKDCFRRFVGTNIDTRCNIGYQIHLLASKSQYKMTSTSFYCRRRNVYRQSSTHQIYAGQQFIGRKKTLSKSKRHGLTRNHCVVFRSQVPLPTSFSIYDSGRITNRPRRRWSTNKHSSTLRFQSQDA